MKEKKIEKDQSLEEAQHGTEYLETLSAVASTSSGVLQLEQVLKKALDKAMEVSKAGMGVIHLLGADNQELVLHIQQGLSSEYLRAYERLKVGEHVAGETAQTGQPIIVEDSTTDPRATPEVLRTELYRSLICLPLRAREEILGTIAVFSTEPKHFTSADVQLLGAVAQQIAIAIESARLFEEKERRVSELAALNEIGQAISSTLNLTQVLRLVAQKTAQICDVERCSILLLDKDKRELVPMMSQFASGAADTGLWRVFREGTSAEKVDDVSAIREVIREHRTVILDKEFRSCVPQRWTEPFGIKSLLLVPLTRRDESIGLMALDYTMEGRHFSAEQVNLATTIGSQVAMAIENARLYEETERRLKESDTLQEISRLVNSSLEPEQIFQTVVETIASAFGYSFVSIYILEGEGLRLRSQVGYDPADVLYFIPLDKGVSGRVARSGKAELIPDVSQDPDFLQAAPGIVSEITVPIKKDDLVLGTLTVESTASEPLAKADLNLISSISHQVSVAIQNARLYERERKKVAQLQTINKAGQEISSVLDLDDMLSRVVRLLQETFDCYNANVFLVDDNSLVLAAGCGGYENGKPPAGKTLGLGEGITGWVAEHGEPLLVDDVSLEPRYFPYQELPETESELAVPIEAKKIVLGVLDVQSKKLSAFDHTDLEALCTLADQLSIGIENARLYETERKRAAQLGVINEVGRRATSILLLDELLQDTVASIQESFDYHFVSILVVNEENREVEQKAEVGRHRYMRAPGYRQSIDEGLIGWVVRNGESLMVNDVGQDPRYLEGFPTRPFTKAELVVPIKPDGKVVAVLDIQSAESNTFEQTDLMSMQTITDQLSVAMQNARLYEEIKEHSTDLEATNRRLIALQDVSTSLVGTLDLQEVLQKLADGVVEGLGYSVAGLAMINQRKGVAENMVFSGVDPSVLKRAERIAGLKIRDASLPLDDAENLAIKTLDTGETLVTDTLYGVLRPMMGQRVCNTIQKLLNLKTIVALPLLVEDQPVGGLLALSDKAEATEEELASLQAFANQGAMAIHNAQLYERTKRRLEELSTLHEISVAATSTLDFFEILDRTIEVLQATLGFTNLALMLLDQEEQRLKIRAGIGYEPEVAQRVQPRLGEGVTGWVALSGEPLNVSDVAKDSRYIVGDEKIRSELCVPLQVGSRIIGVLNIESTQLAAFSDDDLRFLSTLAGQLAVIIENARLFQQVAQGEKEWEDTFRAITDGIAIYDTDLRILRANPALAEILATTHEELIGKQCYEIFSYCHGPTSASCPHRRAMEMREPTSIEVEEPGLKKILHIFSFPIFDEGGNSKGTVHTVRDVTEQQLLRAQLLQTEKLAAIGELISGVAHELNNPLTSVMGYAQLLQTADISEEIKDDLRRIYQEAQRSAKLIENLLTFARKEKAEKRCVNINQVLIDVLKLRSYQLRLDNIELITELDEHLPWTMAAPQQLQQVFLNLINNAHQAIVEYRGEGSLTVRSEKEDEMIRVKVIDTGPGIPQEIVSKIFDPFFTTKEVGQGTGLGLSIAFGIVREHGGRIWAESEIGKGATFTVELPISQGPPHWPEKALSPEKEVPYAGRRILVIDDEEEVLKLIIRILDQMGHQTVALASSEAALDLIDKEEYDVVISDVRMPGIGGQGLYQQVKKRHPELAGRIIFITGDTISDSTHAFLQNVGNPHVTKPFMIEDLQQAIEDVLRREESAC